MNDHSEPRFLYSLEQAAAALGVSTWTLRKHLKLGLEVVRVGNRIVFQKETVERIAREGLPSLSTKTKNVAR